MHRPTPLTAIADDTLSVFAPRNNFHASGFENPGRLTVASGSRLNDGIRPRPQAFLFEFSDVLYDSTAWQRWLSRVLKRLNISCDYDSLIAIWESRYLVDVYRGHREFAEAFAAFLRELGLTHGQIDEVEAASQPRRTQFTNDIRALPGVRRTLDHLVAHGVPLGVLADSDLPVGELRKQLRQLGLEGRFAFILCSLELGSVQPEHAGYLAAVDQFDLPAEQIAFIGHRAAHLRAAAQVGMSTIAFNSDTLSAADLHLDRFDELLTCFSEAHS